MAGNESKKPTSGTGSPGEATKQSEWTGKRLGRFTLGRLLGRGAMGAVFLAEDPDLRRNVALKVLPQKIRSKKDEEQVDIFIREARSAARLEHPHVVRVYEIGRDRGYVFIAMEYLKGGDFQEIVKKEGLFTRFKACEYAGQAAEALGYAHQHGVIHRDIKPSNLMLSHDNRCKLVDFGLAYLEDPGTIDSLKGKIVGTPMYLAPEILRGEEATALSDIYSLGAVLWFTLTGRPPFVGNSLREVRDLQDRWEMPDLKEMLPDYPAGLINILYRAVARRPKERFKDANEFAMMLQSHSVPGGMVIPGVGKIPMANVSRPRPSEVRSPDSTVADRMESPVGDTPPANPPQVDRPSLKSGTATRLDRPASERAESPRQGDEPVSWRDEESVTVRPGSGPAGAVADTHDPGSIALEQLSSIAMTERSQVSGAHSLVRKREEKKLDSGLMRVVAIVIVVLVIIAVIGAALWQAGVFNRFLKKSPAPTEETIPTDSDDVYIPGQSSTPAVIGGGKTLVNDPHGSPSILLDNSDAVGVFAEGAWQLAENSTRNHGRNYLHDMGGAKGSMRVRFYPQLPESGYYDVFLWYPPIEGASTSVPVDISFLGGQAREMINQTDQPGQWHRIGQWRFEEGAAGSITISNADTQGIVLVDAVKFVFQRADDGGVG